MLRPRMLAAALVAGAGLATALWLPTQRDTANAAAGAITWQDEFNAAAGTPVDGTKWAFETGGSGFGNNERQFYTDSTRNAVQDGEGHLVITARKENPAGYRCHYGSCEYTSARLTTASTFTQKYGRFEARMKLPSGRGMWPAFWMLGDDFAKVGWPKSGQIGVMEHIGSEPDTVFGTLHGPGYSGGDNAGGSTQVPRGRQADGDRGSDNDSNDRTQGDRTRDNDTRDRGQDGDRTNNQERDAENRERDAANRQLDAKNRERDAANRELDAKNRELDAKNRGSDVRTRGEGNRGPAFADDFHTFTVDWAPNLIVWSVDGVEYHRATPASLDGDRWVFDHPFFMILNLAVGGDWPGPPDADTDFPQRLTVDYVRVTSRPSAPTPPPTTRPAPPPVTTAPTVGPPTAQPTSKPAPPATTKPPAAKPWAPFTIYLRDQLVTFNGKTYKVLQTHTSLPGWEPPNVPALFLVQ